jgi:hypothetical protein
MASRAFNPKTLLQGLEENGSEVPDVRYCPKQKHSFIAQNAMSVNDKMSVFATCATGIS